MCSPPEIGFDNYNYFENEIIKAFILDESELWKTKYHQVLRELGEVKGIIIVRNAEIRRLKTMLSIAKQKQAEENVQKQSTGPPKVKLGHPEKTVDSMDKPEEKEPTAKDTWKWREVKGKSQSDDSEDDVNSMDCSIESASDEDAKRFARGGEVRKKRRNGGFFVRREFAWEQKIRAGRKSIRKCRKNRCGKSARERPHSNINMHHAIKNWQ